MKRSLVTAVGAGTCAGYGRFVERHAVEVVRAGIELGLPGPLRVAVLGDIHFDPLYESDYLETVVALTDRLEPDLILYTGDFVSRSADRLADLLVILRRASARAGRFAVLGNHDHGVGADRVTAAFASSGIPVLRNRSVPLPGLVGWYLTGLESYWSGTPTVAPITATPPHARHILLVHEPDSFDLLTDPRVALQVSGHTHGRQIRLPRVGAVCLPKWGKKYEAGLYARGDQRLYVNRGIGTVDEHFRLNCRPEITLLTLT
ncbi:MAG TPA: metallophosphoesterase [Urbifossiella sp.]|nr:metallophosphoesterase [Urbifossiella sp.]